MWSTAKIVADNHIIRCDKRKVKQKGRVSMNNLEIRQAMKERRMFNYELAELMGISEFTLSRKLRNELPQEEKERILNLIRNGKAV